MAVLRRVTHGLKVPVGVSLSECQKRTVVEAVGESHHVNGYGAAVGAVEHPLLGQFGVKRNLPQTLEVERVKEDQTGLVRQRSRRQELWDGSWRRQKQVQRVLAEKAGDRVQRQRTR